MVDDEPNMLYWENPAHPNYFEWVYLHNLKIAGADLGQLQHFWYQIGGLSYILGIALSELLVNHISPGGG